jgi:hypothetical protein
VDELTARTDERPLVHTPFQGHARHPARMATSRVTVNRAVELLGLGPGPVADVVRPSPDRLVLLITQVLGHLLVQRRLDDGLGQLLQQPSGPVNDRPCSRASRTNSTAARASADISAGFFFAATSGSLAVITAPSPPALTRTGVSGRKHRLINSPSMTHAERTEQGVPGRGRFRCEGCVRWQHGVRVVGVCVVSGWW